MTEMFITVDFSSPDAPRQAELLAQAYGVARRERLPVDLDLDGELLYLTLSGEPEDLYAVLRRLESQNCRGDILIAFFSGEERKGFGVASFKGIGLEILTWHPEKSAIPKVEVYG